MGNYQNNHYIPQFVLKSFARHSDKGYLVKVYDCKYQKCKEKTIKNVFSSRNMYDYDKGKDIKEIERRLGTEVEFPMEKVVEKILNSNEDIILEDKEIELLRKYVLLQIYRNNNNRNVYEQDIEIKNDISSLNLLEDESNIDFWGKEILTILNSNIYDLYKTELQGLKYYSYDIIYGKINIIRTNDGFILNELGYCIERQIIQKKDKDKFINYANMISPIYKRFYEDMFANVPYVDNFILVPIKSNLAIIISNPIWDYATINNSIEYFGLKSNIFTNKIIDLNKEYKIGLIQINNKDIIDIFNIHFILKAEYNIVFKDNEVFDRLIKYERYFPGIKNRVKEIQKSITEMSIN